MAVSSGHTVRARKPTPALATAWHGHRQCQPVEILLTKPLSIGLALGQHQLHFSTRLKHSELSGCLTSSLQDCALGGCWGDTVLVAFHVFLHTCAFPLRLYPKREHGLSETETQTVPLTTALFYALSIKPLRVDNYRKSFPAAASIAIFRSSPTFNRKKP